MECQNWSGLYVIFQESTIQAVAGEEGNNSLIRCTSKLPINISAQSMEDTFTEESKFYVYCRTSFKKFFMRAHQ